MHMTTVLIAHVTAMENRQHSTEMQVKQVGLASKGNALSLHTS